MMGLFPHDFADVFQSVVWLCPHHSPSEASESVRPPTCSSNAHTNQDISLLARDFRDGFLVWEGIPILQNINHIRGPDSSTAQPPSSSLSYKVASWSWTAMEIGPPFEANTSWAQLEIFGESTPAFVDSCEMLEKACSEYQIPPWWC